MSDLKLWLQSLGLEKYGEVLADHDIDLNVVSELSDQDLQELGLSLGHRRKFMACGGQASLGADFAAGCGRANFAGGSGLAVGRAPPSHCRFRRPRGLDGSWKRARPRRYHQSFASIPRSMCSGDRKTRWVYCAIPRRWHPRLLRVSASTRGRCRTRSPSEPRNS